jgi:hypothetical protein
MDLIFSTQGEALNFILRVRVFMCRVRFNFKLNGAMGLQRI